MKIVRENIYERFEKESDPIDDLNIGNVICPICNGEGSYSDHNVLSIDIETGEHDCKYCPIDVDCECCGGTGFISKQQYKEMTQDISLDQHKMNQRNIGDDSLPS